MTHFAQSSMFQPSIGEGVNGLIAVLAGDQDAIMLLVEMIDRARRIPSYAEEFEAWLRRGDQLALRQVAKPFGDYWCEKQIPFRETVDRIHVARSGKASPEMKKALPEGDIRQGSFDF